MLCTTGPSHGLAINGHEFWPTRFVIRTGHRSYPVKKRSLKLLYLTLAVGFLAMTAFAAFGENAYVGSKNCKKCHIKQHKSWATTNMAQAYETLKPGVKGAASYWMRWKKSLDLTVRH